MFLFSLRAERIGWIFVLLSVATGVAQADAWEEIKTRGTLRAAVPRDYPPFGSVNRDLVVEGYDIDMAVLLARDLGVRLELIPVASANRILYLKTRKVDVIISNLGRSAERERVLLFSKTYAPYFNGVFGPAEFRVTSFQDLAGRVIGVARGSFEDLQLTEGAPKTAVLRRYDDQNATIAAFLSGQVELIGSGNLVAAAILKRNPPKRPELKFLIKQSPCHVGMNLGENQLCEHINQSIARAKQSGELNRISRRWLEADLPPDL